MVRIHSIFEYFGIIFVCIIHRSYRISPNIDVINYWTSYSWSPSSFWSGYITLINCQYRQYVFQVFLIQYSSDYIENQCEE